MSTFGAVVICMLSVVGLAATFWALAGVFLLPVKTGKDCKVHVVVSARGPCPELQRLVRALLWVLDTGVMDFDVVIFDKGLSDETEKCAKILSCSGDVRYADSGDIETYIDV